MDCYLKCYRDKKGHRRFSYLYRGNVIIKSTDSYKTISALKAALIILILGEFNIEERTTRRGNKYYAVLSKANNDVLAIEQFSYNRKKAAFNYTLKCLQRTTQAQLDAHMEHLKKCPPWSPRK